MVVRGARHSAELHELAHEYLSADEIHSRFPALKPGKGMTGVLEPRAGVLFPELCVGAHLKSAERAGATLLSDREVTCWEPAGDGVRVRTRDAEYHGAQMVLSAGSWVSKLVPDLELPLTVERQTLFWFTPREACELNLADPAYLESFVRIDALQRVWR